MQMEEVFASALALLAIPKQLRSIYYCLIFDGVEATIGRWSFGA